MPWPHFRSTRTYWLTRAAYQRAIGLVYLIAFIVSLNQFRPLLGEHGLLPVANFVKQVPFQETPSLFFFAPKDWAFAAGGWLGVILSLVVITGVAARFTGWLNSLVWAAMWVLYLSFVNVGQVFYGFGWETLLLEAGFFGIFLGGRYTEPSILMIYVLRWLEFRIMFGAGLIKLRGDSCWRDFTCLDYHYETQPMPNPLSWYLHWAPHWTHRFGVGFNHFAELLVPFGYFVPQPVASIAGIITIVFQGCIMASGNLSWLNFLTMMLAIPMLDDQVLGRVFRRFLPAGERPAPRPSPILQWTAVAITVLVIFLSVNPVRNMISPDQMMNASFNPLHIVDTYGAFGSITRTRYEILIEGTADAVVRPDSKWLEYQFKAKPGDVSFEPPQVAPYHLRLGWLMWFAAMSNYTEEPWFVNLLNKLLHGDRDTLSLLRFNPFPEHPPQWVRAELYEYHFATPEVHRRTGQWWTRRPSSEYFPAVSLGSRGFELIIHDMGWQ